MRQLFLDKGSLVVKEVAQPLLDDHSMLIGVHYAYISAGTEVAKITMQDGVFSNVPHKVKRVLQAVACQATESSFQDSTQGKVYSLGYACAGRVISVGKKIKKFAPGDLVACADPGYAHLADLVCIPENLAVKVSHEDNLKAASLTTIAAIALQGVRRAQLQLGERVCVFGLNLLGQITVQLAKLSGCYVYATSTIPSRLELAKQFGADEVFHIGQQDFVKEINLLTQRHGVDTTIITTSSESEAIIDNSVAITRKKGKIVIVGDVALNIQRDLFYAKEIDILASTAYGPGSYEPVYEKSNCDYPYAYVRWTENRNMQECLNLIESKKLNVTPLIEQEVSVNNLQKIYARIENKSLLGAVLHYGIVQPETITIPKLEKIQSRHKKISFIPAVSDAIRVGIIGAGDFAQGTLLPLLSRMRNVKINAIVDVDIYNSIRTSNIYGARNSFAQVDELFNDDLIDAVIISTPHTFHCDQALKALEHGKAVFLETPMVADFAQLQQMQGFLSKNNQAPFCVDYNRSFSPFMQKIKKVVQQRVMPLMMNYRINSPFLGKEHWMQSNVGAGRIIGEACQIIDIFCYLTNAKPLSVSVEAMHAVRDDIFPTDNFTAHISFTDGSVCSLLFTAIGHPDIGNERLEIFFDEKAILMEDYMELYGFGLSSWFNETTTAPDYGTNHLLDQFFAGLKKDTFIPPIDFQRLYTVGYLTLVIDELACMGGGKKNLE